MMPEFATLRLIYGIAGIGPALFTGHGRDFTAVTGHDATPVERIAQIVSIKSRFPLDMDGCLPYGGNVMAEQTTARLELRLPSDVHALLKRAAGIEGRTLTDFVVSAAREAAFRTIEATENIRFSVEDQRQIAEALLKPPEPTPALKKAFQQCRELLGVE